MCYDSKFNGKFDLSRQLTDIERDYINTFSGTRRMKRNSIKLMELYHGEYGYPYITKDSSPEDIYGIEGEFFCKNDGDCGQMRDNSIINYNYPSIMQPTLWCQWVTDGNKLEWDGGEKFYHYIEWLKYMIDNFFEKWNVKLNGEVTWEGEDSSDTGTIIVKNNIINTNYE